MIEALRRVLPRGGPELDRFVSWLFSLYLGLAVVYWLPGLGRAPFGALKMAVWVVAVGLVLLPALVEGRLRIPRGLVGPWGFVGLVLLSAPGLVRALTAADVVGFLVDIGASALFLWCFFDLARRGVDLGSVLKRAGLVVAGLSGIALVRALVAIPDWSAPCDRLWAMDAQEGFGAQSTGWSIGIAIYLPMAILFAGAAPPREWPKWAATAATAAGAALILGSQFVSAGRAGLLMSGITVLTFAVIAARPSRLVAALLVGGGLLVGVTALDATCFRHLSLPVPAGMMAEVSDLDEPSEAAPGDPVDPRERRAARQRATRLKEYNRSLEEAGRGSDGSVLNVVSARRMEHFSAAVAGILRRPVTGHGWRQILMSGYLGRTVEVHNLWLRWALYAGLLAPLLFLAIVVTILAAAFGRWWRLRQTAGADLALVLVLILSLGVMASLLEGSVLVGSFHLTALWWAAAGAVLGLESRHREEGAATAAQPGA